MKLLSVFDEHWRSSLPLPLGGVMTGNFIAWAAHLDWGQIVSGAALAATGIGGALIGLYRQWKLTQVEIEERRRRLHELPVDALDPDDTAREETRHGRHPRKPRAKHAEHDKPAEPAK